MTSEEEKKEMRYDIAIIGTGPAGLEAALTAVARNKNILLLGSRDLSQKVTKAHAVQNYLGLPNASGEAMGKAFQEHLDQMGIRITAGKVSMCYAMGDYFALQTKDASNMLEASTVILATGLAKAKGFPGEDEFLGRGVSYCATCDGALYKGKKVAVIGYSQKEDEEADFLADLAEVAYFPQYKGEPSTNEKVKILREKPEAILGDTKVRKLKTDAGEHDVDGIFILRESIAPDKLVPGLELTDGHVKVNLQMETNLPGLFAAGDITGAPYQYIKAAGQGNVAALSAVSYLAKEKKMPSR